MSAYHCLLHTCILLRSQHLCSTRCPCWGALNAISKMIDCLLYCLHRLTCILERNQQWCPIKETSESCISASSDLDGLSRAVAVDVGEWMKIG